MKSNRWLRDLLRIDFSTSVGLYVMRDRIILVRLRKALHNVSLLEQEVQELPRADDKPVISGLTGWIPEDVGEVAIKAGGESTEQALRQAMLKLVPHFSARRDSFYICLPQEQAVVQEIFLPQAAEADLQQVLDYEIERYLPFRRQDVYYDYVPTMKKGDKIGVTLFAVPKKNLAPLLDVLASLGIKVHGVETTVTSLANFLLFCAGDTTDPIAAVGGHDRDLELVGVQNRNGGWRQVPELQYSYWLPESNSAPGTRRELLQQCCKNATRLFGWGTGREALSFANGEQPKLDDLVVVGNQRLSGGLEIAHASVLPAVGAALRGLREASFAGNVLRAELKDEQRGGVLTYVNAALAVLLVLGLLVWGATYPVKDELRLRQLQSENQRLEPSVVALRREEEALQKARREQSFFAELDQRKGEVLRVLDELSKIVPVSAYLSNLRYRVGSLELQGSAENASGLIPLLERSTVFENVGFNAPSNRGRDNRETFSLKAELERPKEKTVKAATK
jgi:general secretion pathway protein L